jgi:hypothetical protein
MAERISAVERFKKLGEKPAEKPVASSAATTTKPKASALDRFNKFSGDGKNPEAPGYSTWGGRTTSGSAALVTPSSPPPETPSGTKTFAAGPRRSAVEPAKAGVITNAKISTPEKPLVQKVAEKGAGIVMKNVIETVLGGPSFVAMPEEIKRNTFSADEQKITEATKRGFTMGVDQYKRLGSRADSFVGTMLDSRTSSTDRWKTTIDLGSSLIVDAGGAVFNAALEVIGSSPAGSFGKQNLEQAMTFISENAGEAASYGSKYLPISEETRKKLDPSIREFAGALAIMATFGLAGKAGAKISKIDRFADTLGMERVVDEKGEARKVTPVEVQEAFKTASDQVIAEGVDVDAKMDVLKSAEATMTSYAELGPERFDAEVQPQLDQFEAKGEKILEDVRGMAEEGVAQTKADAVEGVLKDPITPATRSALQKFDKDMQFAFEQEVFDMNSKNDPNLAKQAAESAVNYERFADPFDDRPAYFDVQKNTIRLNEATIAKTLDALMQGKVLKIGEGRLVSTIRKIAGESFESLKKRYEQELVRHESAHAKTITPEDAARLETALRSGDKVSAEKIRVDLEERASKYVIESADKLTPEIDRGLDAMIARRQIIDNSRATLDSFKFEATEREGAYQRWRDIVRRNDNYEKMNFDEFEAQMKKSPAYKDKSVKSLFEDGLDRGDAATGVVRFNNLFNQFQKRFAEEKKVRADYKRAKAEQKTLFPEAEKMDKRTRTAVNRAIKAEIREQKLQGKVRGLELAKLRERIRRRLEKEVTQEKFDRMSKQQQESFARKEKRREITALLKRARPDRTKGGQLKGKFTAEKQAILDKVEKMTKMDRNEAVSSVMREVEEWRAKNPDDVYLPEELALNVDISEVSGLKNQSLEQLARTEAFIRSVMKEGADTRADALAARRSLQAETKANTLTNLTGSEKGLSPNTRAVIESGKIKGVKAISAWWDTGMLSEFAKALGPEVEKLSKKTGNLADIEKAHIARKSASVENIGEELYGRDWQREYYQDMRRDVDLGEAVFANGEKGKVRTSRLEAMAIYAGLRDGKFKTNLFDAKGNAWTREIANKVLSVLDSRDKQMIERVVEETYAGQYSRFAEAAETRNGIALGKVENYAGPIRYEMDMAKKPDETPADILMDGIRRRLGVSTAGIQSRTGFTGKMRISIDPIADALNYVRQTEHYIQMADKMGDWDAIVRDGDIARAAITKYGQNFWNGFKAHVEDVRKGGIVREQQIAFNRWLQNRQGDISGALIAKPSVWAGQFSSIAQFRAEAKTGGNFWRGVRNFKETAPLLKKYAPAVEARTLQTAAEYVASFEGKRGPIRRGIESWKKLMSKPLEGADKITTTLGASGIFNDRVEYYSKRGRSLEEARIAAGEDVGEIITRTQSTRSYLGKSNLEKRTGIGQVFTTLRNQPNKIARAGVNAIMDWKDKKISTKEMLNFVYWNNVVQPTMYYTMRYATKGAVAAISATFVGNVLGDEEGAEAITEKANSEGFMGGLAANMMNNATGFLVIGDLINLALENGVRGKNYEFRPSVLQAIGDDFASAAVQFGAGDWDEATVLGIRAMSRMYGIGDPGDVLKTMLTTMSKKNTADKAAEKKTPGGRAKAAATRKANAAKKRQAATAKK